MCSSDLFSHFHSVAMVDVLPVTCSDSEAPESEADATMKDDDLPSDDDSELHATIVTLSDSESDGMWQSSRLIGIQSRCG